MSEELTKQISTTNLPKEIEYKIKTAIELKKQLEEYEKDIKDALLGVMKNNDIKSIKHDLYTITRAERTSYKADMDKLSPEFTKQVINVARVSAHKKLYGELPKHVESTTTEYITWRSK